MLRNSGNHAAGRVAMTEIMYDKSSVLIAIILFVSMLVAIECGGLIGRRLRAGADKGIRTQITSLQASLLGILALLLGFTFSQSLQRYDARSAAVVEEANAIGTAYLRARLLPSTQADESMALMREYIASRIAAGAISMDRPDERRLYLDAAKRLQEQLWQLGLQGIETSDRPPTVNLYLQSLNDMFDANTSRDAALNRHVPELVLFLLYGAFILTGSLLGYSAGINASRVSLSTYTLVVLIVVLVFIIIDLDRPRRGLIEVDQGPLIELGATAY